MPPIMLLLILLYSQRLHTETSFSELPSQSFQINRSLHNHSLLQRLFIKPFPFPFSSSFRTSSTSRGRNKRTSSGHNDAFKKKRLYSPIYKYPGRKDVYLERHKYVLKRSIKNTLEKNWKEKDGFVDGSRRGGVSNIVRDGEFSGSFENIKKEKNYENITSPFTDQNIKKIIQNINFIKDKKIKRIKGENNQKKEKGPIWEEKRNDEKIHNNFHNNKKKIKKRYKRSHDELKSSYKTTLIKPNVGLDNRMNLHNGNINVEPTIKNDYESNRNGLYISQWSEIVGKVFYDDSYYDGKEQRNYSLSNNDNDRSGDYNISSYYLKLLNKRLFANRSLDEITDKNINYSYKENKLWLNNFFQLLKKNFISQNTGEKYIENATNNSFEPNQIIKPVLKSSINNATHQINNIDENIDMANNYEEEWAIYAPGMEGEQVRRLARRLGYQQAKQVGGLDGYYVMKKKWRSRWSGNKVVKRRKRNVGLRKKHFLRDPRVKWAELQRIRKRFKRDFLPFDQVSTNETQPEDIKTYKTKKLINYEPLLKIPYITQDYSFYGRLRKNNEAIYGDDNDIQIFKNYHLQKHRLRDLGRIYEKENKKHDKKFFRNSWLGVLPGKKKFGRTDDEKSNGGFELNIKSFKNRRHKAHSKELFKFEKMSTKLKKKFLESSDRGYYVDGAQALAFNDEVWSKQWYLRDSSYKKNYAKEDLGVVSVWRMNITGKGVVVAIIDDGIEYNHTDLATNYDARASVDLNEDDDDPFPRYEETNENKHGTRCAGEVAMVANNSFCGVGVAFNAAIGGIKLLDGVTTDSLEAQALSFGLNHIDIISASWGPSDNGKSLEKPGRLAAAALKRGIEKGRKGKGTIYIWASGNGGFYSDNCNCDGYASSIYTISISSTSENFESPWYAESCPSTFACAYSSGTRDEERIATADLHNECTQWHSGTSASAPLAAGVIALLLEANPHLTWRDVQHLIVKTCNPKPLMHNKGWKKNSAGHWVNNKFGFGLLNVFSLVQAANPSTYILIPPKAVCMVQPVAQFPLKIESGTTLSIQLPSNGCLETVNEVKYLEHIVIVVDISYSRRGDIKIILISPNGMQTELLSERRNDDSKTGFKDWPLMSVHNWGENAWGLWTLQIVDQTPSGNFGMVEKVEMQQHGTLMSV